MSRTRVWRQERSKCCDVLRSEVHHAAQFILEVNKVLACLGDDSFNGAVAAVDEDAPPALFLYRRETPLEDDIDG